MDTIDHLRTFDPGDEFSVVERSTLPHWAQAHCLCFITWRTGDSLPRAVVAQWLSERAQWLAANGIETESREWRLTLNKLPRAKQIEYREFVAERWEARLDDCLGSCVLRSPPLAEIVSQSLRRFDDQRYWLTDFIVMPNHVHLLAAFPSEAGMLAQCKSWKHYTAVQLNRALGRQGRFWQEDQFDHLVRCPEEFARLRNYIADNPRRAGLALTECVYY